MATSCPEIKIKEWDNNGDPAVGYKLYTYETGTTTPKPTYTDADGSIPNANPIVLDSRGEATIYLDGGLYTFVLKTPAEATIWTRDDVFGPPDIATTPISVATVADMKALIGLVDGVRIKTAGYYAENDGGAGEYLYDSASAATADGVKYHAPDTLVGRFILIENGEITDLQAGCKHDGTDSTVQFRALHAATLHPIITGPITVSINNNTGGNATSAIAPQNNQTIEFVSDAATVTNLGQTTASGYSIYYIDSKTDVTLIRPHLIGDKYTHTVTTGENGMGITYVGCTNLKIIDARCEKMHADGIYVGSPASTNTEIVRPICDDNRRQGISVISANGLFIDHPVLINTRSDNVGTTPLAGGPHAGIDIEPNGTTDVLKSIRISNPYTANNQGVGVLISPGAMVNGRTTNTNTEIIVDNHVDDGSFVGARCTGKFLPGGGGSFTGCIKFIKPVWKNSKQSGYWHYVWPSTYPHVELDSPTIVDFGQSSTSAKTASPISVYSLVTETDIGAIGNITVMRPTVVQNIPGNGGDRVMYAVNDWTASGCSNVNLIDPLQVSGVQRFATIASSGTFSDRYSQMRLAINASTSMSSNQIAWVTSDPSATCLITPPNLAIDAPELVFENLDNAAVSLRIDTVAIGCNIKYNGTATYTRMTTADLYARIKLKKKSATLFLVEEAIGTWTPS